MGWSAIKIEGTGWFWTYMAINEKETRLMLKYTNDTGNDVVIESVHFQMGTGNGTFTDPNTVTGTGIAYDVQASAVDSNGTTVYSNTLTITNKVNSSYGGVEKKTFTFASGVFVEAGKSVNISLTFIRTNTSGGYPVVICYGRNNSSYWGGTVSESTGCVWICVDGAWKRATPYICIDGDWKKAKAYVCQDGNW